jgi:hypothetical protein
LSLPSSNNNNNNNATTTSTTNERPPTSSSSALAKDIFSPTTTSPTVSLHYILLLDIASTDLTCELAQRHYSLWCLVRCVVVALWRSKLGGGRKSNNKGGDNNNVTHQVTICYTNGRFQTLTPELLVLTMAEAHQAAPSEYQILQALLTQIPMLDRNPILQMVDHVIDFTVDDNNKTTKSNNNDDVDNDVIDQRFYDPVDNSLPLPTQSPTTGAKPRKTIAILLPINEKMILLPIKEKMKQHSFQNSIINASSKRGDVPMMVNGHHLIQLPLSGMMDRPATFITMVQHLAYQNRLLPLLLSLKQHAS